MSELRYRVGDRIHVICCARGVHRDVDGIVVQVFPGSRQPYGVEVNGREYLRPSAWSAPRKTAPFDVNDPDQLPDDEWLDNPPTWFRYFCDRLAANASAGEVWDALEKVSPSGSVPAWFHDTH
jgi:hypothetical protein